MHINNWRLQWKKMASWVRPSHSCLKQIKLTFDEIYRHKLSVLQHKAYNILLQFGKK